MEMSNTAEDRYEGKVGPNRKKMPVDRASITHKIAIEDVTDGQVYEGYIIRNVYEDGTLGEVFLQGFGKQGSTLEGWVQVAAILFSTALQYGAEFPVLARKLAYTKFPPYGYTSNEAIPYCRSVPDYIVRWLVLHSGDVELWNELKKIDEELGR